MFSGSAAKASQPGRYFHGLLIVERGKESRYVSFVAKEPEDEGQAFGRFVTELAGFLARHPKVPIYHYHSCERTHARPE